MAQRTKRQAFLIAFVSLFRHETTAPAFPTNPSLTIAALAEYAMSKIEPT